MPSVLNEHYRYLTLANRNAAYARALGKVVQPGDVVADLGCGFGILGLLALEAGATHCHGVDYTAAIEIARETMRREGLADHFTAMRGSTFETDLPTPVDLLVCDHIGYFGFDYGIIAMLADARKRMLKAGGRIMPQSMDMHIALAESPILRDKAARWDAPGMPPAFGSLREYEANAIHSHRFPAEAMLSGPATIASVDFREDAADLFTFKDTLTATRDGVVDGICGFFAAALCDTVSMTNSPFAADAIGRANAFLPCRTPFAVRAGDAIAVSLSIRHDPRIVNWTITPPAGGEKQAMSTWHSQILSSEGLGMAGT